MQKVQDAVQAKRDWLNTHMQALAALHKHVTPPVKCGQILAEKAVSRVQT